MAWARLWVELTTTIQQLSSFTRQVNWPAWVALKPLPPWLSTTMPIHLWTMFRFILPTPLPARLTLKIQQLREPWFIQVLASLLAEAAKAGRLLSLTSLSTTMVPATSWLLCVEQIALVTAVIKLGNILKPRTTSIWYGMTTTQRMATFPILPIVIRPPQNVRIYR